MNPSPFRLSFATFGLTLGVTLGASFLLGHASPARADNENLLLGNPSGAVSAVAVAVPAVTSALEPATLDAPLQGAVKAPVVDPNNLLIEHPAFSLAYDQSSDGPKWVSWHLAQSDRGRTGRSEDFRPDEALPSAAQIRPTDYRGSGYDRGHQCPSGDRTADKDLNSETFLMSNMLPQTPDLNRQLWRKFEEYCRDQLKGGENEEYVVCGGAGSLDRIGDGRVNVPAFCWKIALILPTGGDDLKRIDATTRVVAVLMPNRNGPEIASGKWSDYLTSVDKIEELTKLDLLSNLPVEVQKVLEARVDTGRAPVRATAAG